MTIGIFASGRGSNAKNIIEHFKSSSYKFIVFTNNSDATVIDVASELSVSCVVFRPNENLNEIMKLFSVDFIVLAGYIKLIPKELIFEYTGKIINIHPSLLPKFGGKGMWGMNVHKAVIQSGEIESGITIHYVSEKYDDGEIIEQHRCSVLLCDTPETLSKKISELEKFYFPKCIERLLAF